MVPLLGSLTVSDNALVDLKSQSGLIVGGDIVLSSSSLISLSSSSNITVQGCANLSGTLQIDVPPDSTSGSFTAMTFSCKTGSFTSIVPSNSSDCAKTTITHNYTQTSLEIGFTVNRDDCQGGGGGLDNTTVYIIIGASIGGVILIAAVLLAIPQVRQRVFPYRDRKRFTPSPKEAIY